MPSDERVDRRIWWLTVSKAADRSSRIRTDELKSDLLFIVFVIIVFYCLLLFVIIVLHLYYFNVNLHLNTVEDFFRKAALAKGSLKKVFNLIFFPFNV